MPESHATSARGVHIASETSPEETHKGGLQVAIEKHDPTTRRFSLCAIRPDFSCLPPRIIGAQQPPDSAPIVYSGAPEGYEAAAPGDASDGGGFSWTVLWDIENVPVTYQYNGAQVVDAVGKALNALRPDGRAEPAPVRRITTFTNVNNMRVVLRNELQAMGVQLMHVETEGRKDAADKALIVELVMTALDYPPPHGICLISGDQDYAYALAVLKRRGYATAVIGPVRRSCSPLLMNVPDYAMSMMNEVLKDVPPRRTPKYKIKRNARRAAGATVGGASPAAAAAPANANGNGNERPSAATARSRRWPLLFKVLCVLFPARSQTVKQGAKNINTSRDITLVLITMLSCYLMRSALLGFQQLADSDTARVVFHAFIDAVHWPSAALHLVVVCILAASIRSLRRSHRYERGHNKKYKKKKPTSLVNPPNL